MSLFGKKHSDKVILVFDIGSSEVSAGLIQLGEENEPTIVFTATKQIPFQKNLNFSRFFSSMLNTLDDVSLLVQSKGLSHLTFTKRGDKAIDKIYCILSSAWYVADVSTIYQVREENFHVTHSLIKNLLKKKMDKFKDGALQRHAEKLNTSVRIIEESITQIRLNGYETSKPFNKVAKKIEISLYASIIGEDIAKHIDSIIGKVFRVGSIHYHTFSHVAFAVLRDIFPEEENFIFFDMTGEITDVAFSKNGTLKQVISFPQGKRTLMRELAKVFATSPEEALSRVVLYSKNKMDESVSKIIKSKLDIVFKNWQDGFDRSLNHLAKISPLPRKSFFTSDEEMSDIILSSIKPTKEDIHPLLQQNITKTTFIGEKFISKYVSSKKKVKSNAFLNIEAIFLAKIHDIEDDV